MAYTLGMAGRPSIYTEELGIEICARMACGIGVKKISEADDMPNASTIFAWALNPNHPFSDLYAHARKIQAESFVDEITAIVDDGTNDWITTEKGDMVNNEAIQRSRLRFQARQWLASKFLPKAYGDKLNIEQAGIVEVKVSYADPEKSSLGSF